MNFLEYVVLHEYTFQVTDYWQMNESTSLGQSHTQSLEVMSHTLPSKYSESLLPVHDVINIKKREWYGTAETAQLQSQITKRLNLIQEGEEGEEDD